jgi:hypothetical protein
LFATIAEHLTAQLDQAPPASSPRQVRRARRRAGSGSTRSLEAAVNRFGAPIVTGRPRGAVRSGGIVVGRYATGTVGYRDRSSVRLRMTVCVSQKAGLKVDSSGISERAAQAFVWAESWVSSEAMADLLDLFDGRSTPDEADLTGWLHLNEELPDWLDPLFGAAISPLRGLSAGQTGTLRRTLQIERLAGSVFNFRTTDGTGYRERSQAVDADFDEAIRTRILDLTRQLGLVDPQEPRFDGYDKTLVLGGGYRSPLLRTRYAAQIRDSGVPLGEVAFLGSPRFLIAEPPEREVAVTYAPAATDEFGLMVGAVRAAFGMDVADVAFLCGCADDSAQCPRWRQRLAKNADDTPAAFTHERQAVVVDPDGRTVGSVLSASTGRPPYRPDTSDTLDLWARCADPRPGQRVLLVTTQVFVPFQTFDALRRLYLPYGVEVDAVGFGADWGDRPQTAEYLLQETLSAIRSARRLLIDATETLAA